MTLTRVEKAEIKRRSRYADASLACEGITLTNEEARLFMEMDAIGLTHEQRLKRIAAYLDEISAPQLIAVE